MPAWPRLNLPAANLRELRLYTKVPVSEEIASLLPSVLDDEGGFLSVTSYRRSARDHFITSFIYVDEDAPATLEIRVRYDATGEIKSRVPSSLKREDEFMVLLERLSMNVEMGFAAEFEFTAVREDELWFPLPLSFPDPRDERSHFEIRGVQGVHTALDAEQGDWDFHFTVDRPPNEGVLMTLRWQDELTLDAQSVSVGLDRARLVAQQLVTRRTG